MNFNELMAKMRELDTPTTSAPETTECGDMPRPVGSPMSPPPMSKPDTPPPTMSINLNAQGLDNIEELMKLIKQVNPDMEKPMGGIPSMAPSIEIEPMSKPMGGLPSLGNLDTGPLKMLPDLDKEPSNEPDIEIDKSGPDMMNKPDDSDDGVSKSQGDIDNDGDHDMDDHDAEKKKGKEDEAFMNSPDGASDAEVRDVDDVIMRGNDIHKPKGTYPKVAGGDNPMQRTQESTDLRAQIRAELLQRLAEAKGAK